MLFCLGFQSSPKFSPLSTIINTHHLTTIAYCKPAGIQAQPVLELRRWPAETHSCCRSISPSVPLYCVFM